MDEPPKTTLITGKTYPVREQLRALGGLWDPDLRGWRVPMANAEAARNLVANCEGQMQFDALEGDEH